MHLDELGVVRFEVTLSKAVKVDQDGHDFTGTQLSRPSPTLFSTLKLLRFPLLDKAEPEIIDMTE
jgi:hypothetical protein